MLESRIQNGTRNFNSKARCSAFVDSCTGRDLNSTVRELIWALSHLDSNKFPTFWNDCHDRACLGHTHVHSQADCSGVFNPLEEWKAWQNWICRNMCPPEFSLQGNDFDRNTWKHLVIFLNPVTAKENANFRQICPTRKNHGPQDVGASILTGKLATSHQLELP